MTFQLRLTDVQSVYSGKPGCCCGCLGKHTYASATRAAAAEHRGYAIDDNEVSDRTVALIIKKMRALIEGGAAERVSVSANHISVELPGRVYVAYFTR